eukprot:TRINITY_DN18996_c0_g1_i1.p1 TRINITY_DN18996_c0_g1~~TRINITY_DN18996_c0_g1_i1.p1  ORF type:complete len:437 (-),score=94.18 TRINITY_DN18996_c0_g1_i1:46-1287(-)
MASEASADSTIEGAVVADAWDPHGPRSMPLQVPVPTPTVAGSTPRMPTPSSSPSLSLSPRTRAKPCPAGTPTTRTPTPLDQDNCDCGPASDDDCDDGDEETPVPGAMFATTIANDSVKPTAKDVANLVSADVAAPNLATQNADIVTLDEFENDLDDTESAFLASMKATAVFVDVEGGDDDGNDDNDKSKDINADDRAGNFLADIATADDSCGPKIHGADVDAKGIIDGVPNLLANSAVEYDNDCGAIWSDEDEDVFASTSKAAIAFGFTDDCITIEEDKSENEDHDVVEIVHDGQMIANNNACPFVATSVKSPRDCTTVIDDAVAGGTTASAAAASVEIIEEELPSFVSPGVATRTTTSHRCQTTPPEVAIDNQVSIVAVFGANTPIAASPTESSKRRVDEPVFGRVMKRRCR